jgi:hypothetical protein
VKFRIAGAAVAATSALVLSGMSASPADAARCVSGAEVRDQVSAFVQTLRDDVKSQDARTAVKGALVESVKTARGAKADSAEERQILGEEISALAKQLEDAPGLVERKALIAEIHALQEQKRADRLTRADVKEIKTDLRSLKRAIVAKTDHVAEGRAVADFFHALMDQFNC